MTVKDADRVSFQSWVNSLWKYMSYCVCVIIISVIPSQLPRTRLQLEGTHKNLFSVVPEATMVESPVQLQVKLPQELDYETLKEIVLQVSNIQRKEL